MFVGYQKRGYLSSHYFAIVVQWRMSNRTEFDGIQTCFVLMYNHQSYQKLIKRQQMRQVSQSNSPQQDSSDKIESLESRKERIDKKRTIRKNKIQKTIERSSEEMMLEMPTNAIGLTKEEKMMIQKVRNREAAQRSREIHKKYVQDIEKENQNLKKKLSTTFFVCKHCNKRNTLGDCGVNTDSEGTKQLESEMEFQQEKEDFSRMNDFLSEGEQNFTRANINGKSSLFGILFIVCVISVCLFTLNPSTNQSKRVLLQLSPKNTTEILPQNDQTIAKKQIIQVGSPQFNQGPQGNGVVPIGFKFRPFQKELCLQSILKQTVTAPLYYEKKHLTNNFVSMDFTSSISTAPNYLFCESPKVYRNNNPKSSIISNILNIMVSGSEMMEILSYTHLPLAFDKIVQFDGIYRITAEVKDIVRVEDHSCLA